MHTILYIKQATKKRCRLKPRLITVCLPCTSSLQLSQIHYYFTLHNMKSNTSKSNQYHSTTKLQTHNESMPLVRLKSPLLHICYNYFSVLLFKPFHTWTLSEVYIQTIPISNSANRNTKTFPSCSNT